jgi:serine/threonine-protein kinase RsbW
VGERTDSLRIESKVAEIERASAWLDQFAAATGVPQAVIECLLVAVDEILNNIIRHGRRKGRRSVEAIQLDLSVGADRVALTVTDDGQPFDPSIAPTPETLPTSTRQPGGAGLLFVQSLMDEMQYARIDGRNRVVLGKRLPALAG